MPLAWLVPIDFTGQLLWSDEKCYKYELHQLENCKNKLILNKTYVTCDEDEKDLDEEYQDYELFNTFDNKHRQAAKPPPVKVDKETICKILKLEKSCK